MCKLCFFAGNEDALLSELNKKKDFYLLVESFGSSKRTLSVEDIYNRGCRAKGSELTIALHKFIYDKQFEKFIHLLSSSRHSLDTQSKSDAAPYCKSMGEVCRLASFKDPCDPHKPDSLVALECRLEQPGFDLLAAEIGGTSTASIRTYADQSQGSRKQSLKGFIGELQREAINPVEIFLTKSIRELEKYVNNQSKPSFMDSSHAARRQFAQEKADRLREMLDFCRSMNGTAEEINELQTVFIMPIVTEFQSPLERAKEQFGRRSLRGLGAVLKQFEKNRQALCLPTSVAELLERGHEEDLQQVHSLQSGYSSFQTAEAVRPVMEEDTQRQPAAFVPFEVRAPEPGA
ncbi:DEAD/DEAH box helicase [Piscirickettsia salmonis]|nr:DEAD/DEAH box helicase [Piscirickettsia salmonis]